MTAQPAGNQLHLDSAPCDRFECSSGFLVLMTSFTRIVIVLGFVRTSLGTQQMPPNQVLVGLALFLTLFIMSPTLSGERTGIAAVHERDPYPVRGAIQGN